MGKPVLLKNIEYAHPQELKALVDYGEGRVVSRTFAQNPHLSFTLFAFDRGEGISAHTVPAEAFVQVLDGEASITVDEQTFTVKAGQVLAMPSGVPHALEAKERFKMLLLVVRPPLEIETG